MSQSRAAFDAHGAEGDGARIKAALGSLAFLLLAPGVVAGLMPGLITDGRPLPPGDGPGPSAGQASS